MKLIYRSIAYTLNSSLVNSLDNLPVVDNTGLTAKTTIVKYRGAIFYVSQPERFAKPQPALKLHYRGTPHRTVPLTQLASGMA